MATVRDYSLKEIQGQHSAIAKSFSNWAKPLRPITGWNGNIKTQHVYRVVHVNSFSTVNVFQQLKAMVGQKEMENQTLIVIPGKGGGYYIVNSQESLKDGSLTGSNTCDPLLLIQPG